MKIRAWTPVPILTPHAEYEYAFEYEYDYCE